MIFNNLLMKLINVNIGLNIDNSAKVAKFLKKQDTDFITLQEVIKPLDKSAKLQYASMPVIEKEIVSKYPYRFFGPLWTSREVFKNGKIITNYGGYIEQGNQTFSKLQITYGANIFFYKNHEYIVDITNWEKEDHGRALLVTEHLVNDRTIQIINTHGIWTRDKTGDERTLNMCKYIVNLVHRKKHPTIIVGDFNLSPNTESIKFMSQNFTSLIDKYNIKSTRPHLEDEPNKNRSIVDYVFVTKGIIVKDFKVIETNISDHYPLYLEFEA